ncbi:hypothetical protein Syun_021707 [Stephania yunnanensis]|uniref:Uncharacterized protein n=1 Tax=Stephania yunnanensis TaxID=152371 RepID=A0AAP0NRB8_9MAGN
MADHQQRQRNAEDVPAARRGYAEAEDERRGTCEAAALHCSCEVRTTDQQLRGGDDGPAAMRWQRRRSRRATVRRGRGSGVGLMAMRLLRQHGFDGGTVNGAEQLCGGAW